MKKKYLSLAALFPELFALIVMAIILLSIHGISIATVSSIVLFLLIVARSVCLAGLVDVNQELIDLKEQRIADLLNSAD